MNKKLPLILYSVFAILLLLIYAAPLFPGHAKAEENRAQAFHPPSAFCWEGTAPVFYAQKMSFDVQDQRVYSEDRSRKFYLWKTVSGQADFYFLGADSRGRDLVRRILEGTRWSLAMAMLGNFLSLGLGLGVGAAAGYYGGKTDNFLMRAAELVMMIPGFYLLLAVRSVLPQELDSRFVFALIICVLGLLGWGNMARVIRGLVLTLREREFVQAARLCGKSDAAIFTGHILPYLAPTLFALWSLSMPGFILAESALSLLGLGLQDPYVSLGLLLNDALSIAHIQYHPWILWPGIWLGCIACYFYALGDFLNKQMAGIWGK